ncbi:MAG: CoA transferase subunit A [Syntrophomonadaceae bacterium]
MAMEDKRMSIKEAVEQFVTDGCSLTFSSVANREPCAACSEIIRQGRKQMTFITDSQSYTAELLIAAGCINKLEAAYVWGGVHGQAYMYRRAVEKGIPVPLEVEDYSNLGMSYRFMAGACGLPFMPIRTMLGSDIIKENPKIKVINDPYGSGPIALVPAAQPDVAFIHVQFADKSGNAQIWGVGINDDLIARAAQKVVITCEKIIPSSEIRKIPGMTAIQSYCVAGVVEVPFGSHPLGVAGFYWTDMPFRKELQQMATSHEGIVEWLDKWVYGVKDHNEYVELVGYDSAS